MFKSRIYTGIISLIIIFGICTVNFVMAGETAKIKGTATSVNTKWHQIEIGDVEGHILGLYENTQLWVMDPSGEKPICRSRGIMDLNPKTGQGTMQGYSAYTYSNGDKLFSSYDGKLVGKGQWEGTWTNIGGTGKYEGLTGGGTWAAKSLGSGVSEITSEGERTLK